MIYDSRGNITGKDVYPDSGTASLTSYTYGNTVWADRLTAYVARYTYYNLFNMRNLNFLNGFI